MTTNGIEFPDWGDLGNRVSQGAIQAWESHLEELNRYHYYFSGEVFNEFAEKEHQNDPDIPLFPAGVNLVKLISTAIADSMFGEYADQPLTFSIGQDTQNTDSDQKSIQLAAAILRESNAATALWECELDRNAYGGGILRAAPKFDLEHKIRWSRVQVNNFYPIWDPEDPDNLLEAYIMTYMDPAQASAKYGYTGGGTYRIAYTEHWTRFMYETFLDKQSLKTPTEHGWKIVPMAFIPRLRTTTWWGDALTEDLMPMQDELNMRLADISDAVSNNAHPIKWGKNLPKQFDRTNYPIGSDQMWDIGRDVNDRKPEVGILEPQGNYMDAAFKLVSFLLQMAREHAATPGIAYGDDNGGGQRSGDTLEIRLRSLMSSVRRSRSYFNTGIARMLKITQAIYGQKELPGIPVGAVKRLTSLATNYAPVLPRNRASIVDEVVKLRSMDPPAVSLETASIKLGHGVGEVDRIKDELKDKELKDADPNSLSNGRALPAPGRAGQSGGASDGKGVQPASKDSGK